MGRVAGFDRESNTVQVEVDKSSLSRGYDGHLNSKMEASARDRQVINVDVARDFDKIGAFKEDRINISVGDEIRFTDTIKTRGQERSQRQGQGHGRRRQRHRLFPRAEAGYCLQPPRQHGRCEEIQACRPGVCSFNGREPGYDQDFVIGALNVKPQPASNDLNVLIRETGVDCTNRQFERWNRNLSEYESGYENTLSLKDKGGKDWKATASIAVADIAKTERTPDTPRW